MELAQMTKHEGGRYHDGEMFLPWYTSPCLEWLMTLDLKGKFIFEYGVGHSTVWYKSKGAITYGVDSTIEWLQVAAPNDSKCGYYLTSDKDRYIKGWTKVFDDIYDIVIIDGIYRDECTEYALKMLKPGGYLILDNYMQPSVEMNWEKTNELIKGMPITIYKEPEHYDWCTAVITKP